MGGSGSRARRLAALGVYVLVVLAFFVVGIAALTIREPGFKPREQPPTPAAIVPCVNCHGEDGRGSDEAGQKEPGEPKAQPTLSPSARSTATTSISSSGAFSRVDLYSG